MWNYHRLPDLDPFYEYISAVSSNLQILVSAKSTRQSFTKDLRDRSLGTDQRQSRVKSPMPFRQQDIAQASAPANSG